MEIRLGRKGSPHSTLPLSNTFGSFPIFWEAAEQPSAFWPGAWQANSSGHTNNFLFLITFRSSEMFVLILSQLWHFCSLFIFSHCHVEDGVETSPFGPSLTITLLYLLSEPQCPVWCQTQKRFSISNFHTKSASKCVYMKTCQQNLESQQKSTNTFVNSHSRICFICSD